jgi:hypothetical protein
VEAALTGPGPAAWMEQAQGGGLVVGEEKTWAVKSKPKVRGKMKPKPGACGAEGRPLVSALQKSNSSLKAVRRRIGGKPRQKCDPPVVVVLAIRQAFSAFGMLLLSMRAGLAVMGQASGRAGAPRQVHSG